MQRFSITMISALILLQALSVNAKPNPESRTEKAASYTLMQLMRSPQQFRSDLQVSTYQAITESNQ